MKISSIAKNNFKGNIYRYIMYLLSNAFAVTSFFIFINFIFHPDVNFENLAPSSTATQGAVMAVKVALIIIVIFSVFFVAYSTSIFLKSRGKEFGLLSLYGMTKKQIRKFVGVENTIIALLSIFLGTTVGIIFSKLFLMVMSNLINFKLAFHISLKAMGITSVVFFLLIEIISYIMLFKIKDEEIIDQIKSTKMPKKIPNFSKRKAILGVLLLIIGYTMAWFATDALVIIGMIPITTIVIIGTYFFVTEFSIFIINKLMNSTKIKYNKVNLIAFSQMVFKLQDTAKVLFLVSILGAVSFTATETVYTFYKDAPKVAGFDTPEDYGVMQLKGEYNNNKFVNMSDELFKKESIDIKYKETMEPIEIKDVTSFDGKGGKTELKLVLSQSDYNKALKITNSKDLEKLSLKKGEAAYLYTDERFNPNKMGGSDTKYKVDSFNIKYADNKDTLNLKNTGEQFGLPYGFRVLGYIDAFVISDEDYQMMNSQLKEKDKLKYTAYVMDLEKTSTKEVGRVSGEVFNLIRDEEGIRSNSKWYSVQSMREAFGLVLFIGFFLSFLFFIASGSIIYFKLFNEIKQDKLEYDILSKIGLKKSERNKIISKQIAIIFFLPFIISTAHSLFALKSLSNLLNLGLIKNGLTVMLAYMVFQVIYFIVIRKIYINKISLDR